MSVAIPPALCNGVAQLNDQHIRWSYTMAQPIRAADIATPSTLILHATPIAALKRVFETTGPVLAGAVRSAIPEAGTAVKPSVNTNAPRRGPAIVALVRKSRITLCRTAHCKPFADVAIAASQ
jgi:hypothetical protein